MISPVSSIVGIILLVTMLLTASAQAWDNRRKGFVFGASVGAATIPQFLEYDYSGYRLIQAGTELTIGYAPTDQLQIHYAGRTLWFPFWALIASPSAGVTYYLKPEAPSFFFTGGGGMAVVSVGPYLIVGEPGGNVFAGFGYEWSQGWRVSLEYTHYWWHRFDNVIDDVRICIGGLGY